MKKKIAVIIERANIALGGAERSVFELTSALSMLGHKVTILAARGKTRTKNMNVLCHSKTSKRTCYYTFAKALKKHLSENRYDIIHSTLPFDFADIYQPRGGSFAEAILRNAVSYQNRFVEPYKKITAFANFRRTAFLRAEKKLCKNPDGPKIAALSKYVADCFVKHYNLDNDRITVIPNGVKTDKRIDTAKADKLRAQILNQLSLREADNPILLLFVANNFRLKGLTCLIEAMQLAKQFDTERKCYLVVAGNDRTHKYRSLAKKLNIHKEITFLGTIRHIQNALSIIDVAILPTFYDPSSRYILEAITAEKPVITTKFNGAVDLFVNDRHGKVIDRPENINALAKAIRYFTSTDNIQKASEAIATDNLKENISISRVAQQLISLYNEILQKRRQ